MKLKLKKKKKEKEKETPKKGVEISKKGVEISKKGVKCVKLPVKKLTSNVDHVVSSRVQGGYPFSQARAYNLQNFVQSSLWDANKLREIEQKINEHIQNEKIHNMYREIYNPTSQGPIRSFYSNPRSGLIYEEPLRGSPRIEMINEDNPRIEFKNKSRSRSISEDPRRVAPRSGANSNLQSKFESSLSAPKKIIIDSDDDEAEILYIEKQPIKTNYKEIDKAKKNIMEKILKK